MTRAKAMTVLVVFVFAGAAFADWQVVGLSGRVGAESHEALTLARAIQAERIDFIRTACQQQNDRHRATVLALDQILIRAERAAPPLRRAQIQESRASTLLLIDQLAPLRNCRLALRATINTP